MMIDLDTLINKNCTSGWQDWNNSIFLASKSNLPIESNARVYFSSISLEMSIPEENSCWANLKNWTVFFIHLVLSWVKIISTNYFIINITTKKVISHISISCCSTTNLQKYLLLQPNLLSKLTTAMIFRNCFIWVWSRARKNGIRNLLAELMKNLCWLLVII